MLNPTTETLLNGYFNTLMKAWVDMWLTTKALEILTKEKYGEEAFGYAMEKAKAQRPSWTTGLTE